MANNLLGGINFADFSGIAWKPTQEAASAWAVFDGENLAGASYRPLLYIGSQVTKGMTYHFIAEETLILAEPEKHIVKLAVNKFNNEYKYVPHSLEVIF